MNHEEYKEMLELAALDALGEAESRVLQAHLDACEECRAELAELRDAAAALVYLIEPVTPPATLRSRALASVRAMQAELASLSRRNEEMQEVAARLSNQNGVRQSQPEQLPNRNDRPQVEAPVQRATNEPPATVSPFPQPSPATTAPDAHVVELAGTNKAPQSHARLVYDANTGVISLTVSDLPPAPAGKAYQLWFIVGGHAIPGGVFVTGPEGRATMHGQISAEAHNATAFVITLEKSNGSNKPTGAKYLLGANS